MTSSYSQASSIKGGLHCLLVEDQQILLDLLATIVDAFAEITIVSKATAYAEAISISQAMSVDLAILDLHLPDGDGNDLAKILANANPAIQLIILTGAPEDFRNSPELRGSIRALIDKQQTFEALYHTLSTILQPAYQTLTPRQSEIFELIGAGKSNKDIARILSSATSTIESHRKAIAQKLNLSGAELVREASLFRHISPRR